LTVGACRSRGVDPVTVLPLVEQELRRLGAAAHADALRAALVGK
jgi:hypothetical protein